MTDHATSTSDDLTQAPAPWPRNPTSLERKVAERARELTERDSWYSRFNTDAGRLAQAIDELGLKIVKTP